jgi:hypothetical protein
MDLTLHLALALAPAGERELAHQLLIFLGFVGFSLLIDASADGNGGGYRRYGQEADKAPNKAPHVEYGSSLEDETWQKRLLGRTS